MNQLKEDLIAARSLIEKGWNQGQSMQPNTQGVMCYCTLGAIGWGIDPINGVTSDSDHNRRYDQAKAAIAAQLSDKLSSAVVFWNDRTGQTQDEVLKVFDLAILAAEPLPC